MGNSQNQKTFLDSIIGILWEKDYNCNRLLSSTIEEYKKEYPHLADLFREKTEKYIVALNEEHTPLSVEAHAENIFKSINEERHVSAKNILAEEMKNGVAASKRITNMPVKGMVGIIAGIGLMAGAYVLFSKNSNEISHADNSWKARIRKNRTDQSAEIRLR